MEAVADTLTSMREAGARQFAAHGLPTRRVEEWRYTPLQGLENQVAASATFAPRVEGASGRDGLEVMSLESGLAGGQPGLAGLLESLDIAKPAQAMSALNNSTLRDGLFIRVQAGCDAGQLDLFWPHDSASSLANSRVCIVLEKGASLAVFEHFDGDTQGALNVVLQVDLAAGASCTHFRLQAAGQASALVTRTEVTQASGSRYRYTGLDLAGELVRHDLRAQLQGAGADCVLNGAYLLSGRTHVDNHLEIEHQAPECTSSQLYRGVLHERSRAVFSGRVHVHPGADGTEARQFNANLLLSEHAEVYTKPELEIEADEVVASHGATVGQLDEDAIFYLRSRGLDEAAARKMLTGAFCQAVVDELDEGPVRDAMYAALDQATGAIS